MPLRTFRQTIHQAQDAGNAPAGACDYAKAVIHNLLAEDDRPPRRAFVKAAEMPGANKIEVSVTVVDDRARRTWISSLDVDDFARDLDANVRRLRCWL